MAETHIGIGIPEPVKKSIDQVFKEFMDKWKPKTFAGKLLKSICLKLPPSIAIGFLGGEAKLREAHKDLSE